MDSGKGRRSKDERSKLIKAYLQEWKESGKTQRAFSLEKGINYYTFNKWLKDDKCRAGSARPFRKGFTALSVQEAPSSRMFAEIKKNDTTVIFHQAVTPEFLRTLLQ